MIIPEYSINALNVLSEFHRINAIIFVEGQDDLHFWNNIAQKADIKSIRIEHVGGAEELQKKIEAILSHDAQIIVAKDADHDQFSDSPISHPRIVNTYGYSIENSLYCPSTIGKFAASLARSLDDYSSVVVEWYDKFSDQVNLLLVYDVANHIYDRGVKVFGDTCARFLKNKKSSDVSSKKIDDYLLGIKGNFTEEEIDNCIKLIESDGRKRRWLIKGHFITNALINLVKEIAEDKRGKTISISLDHVYTTTIDGCSYCIPATCCALDKMTNDLKKAVGSL